jgi:hypothetical protein
LWEEFLPNLSHTHVLCCWGVRDTKSAQGTTKSEHGGVAGLNRRLIALCQTLGIAALGYQDPEKGHGDVLPPAAMLDTALAEARTRYPGKIRHSFRWLYQSPAYWLEAFEWKGEGWTKMRMKGELRPNETPGDMMAREIRVRLGLLEGEVNGQTISINRKHVDDIVLWLGDGMIDWDQPVLFKASGKREFEGAVSPDLYVCLAQAARTYDFDRLRWAGLRYKSGTKPRMVTGDMEFALAAPAAVKPKRP